MTQWPCGRASFGYDEYPVLYFFSPPVSIGGLDSLVVVVGLLHYERLGDDPQAGDGIKHHKYEHGMLAALRPAPVVQEPQRYHMGEVHREHVARDDQRDLRIPHHARIKEP
ncbi:MAG: hypothetical protein WKH64_02510 [Chloroflexia bacterium]